MVNLKAKPFYLDDEAIKWVEETKNSMTDEEKAEQIMCPLMFSDDKEVLKDIIASHNFGAVMFRTGAAAKVQENLNVMQEVSKIPLLIAANLEDGEPGVHLREQAWGVRCLWQRQIKRKTDIGLERYAEERGVHSDLTGHLLQFLISLI